MSWTRGEVTILIEEYRKWPNLYKIKSANYKNRNLRKQALEGVLGVLKDVKPEITIQEIQSKFQALKQTAAKEKKKLAESQKSGAGCDDIVEPSLWYYGIISYIFDDAEPRKSIDSLDDIENSQASSNVDCQNWIDEQDDKIDEQEEIIVVFDEAKETPLFSPETSRPPSRLSIHSGQTPSRPATSVSATSGRSSLMSMAGAPKGKTKRKRTEEDTPIMGQVSCALSNISKKLEENSNPQVKQAKKSSEEIFGEYVAAKMEKVTVPEIRDELEANIIQLINNALRECREHDNN